MYGRFKYNKIKITNKMHYIKLLKQNYILLSIYIYQIIVSKVHILVSTSVRD